MKKYNLLILFLFLLSLVGVGGYIYFLDVIYDNKIVDTKIVDLKNLEKRAQQPIVSKISQKELILKQKEYEDILYELELEGKILVDNQTIVLTGSIEKSHSYTMLKKLLGIIKNDSVKLESMCIGLDCNEYKFGFFIKITPLVLNFQ